MKQLLKIFVPALFALVVVGCETSRKNDSNEVAEEQNETKFDTPEDEKEAEFVAEAIEDSYAEIKLAELASTKSSNKEVQEIAQQLVNDHAKTLTELQNIATEKGISTPVEEGEDTKKKINDLAKEDEPGFDKKWCDALVDNHKKTIREFESMRDKSEDPELKELINNTLPDLRARLDRLNSVEKNLM